MAARSHDWSRCDLLLREVGALRAASSRRTDLGDVLADMNLRIVAAAQAVDALIDSPDSDEMVFTAWEAIVLARDVIHGLRQATAHSGDLVSRAVKLRKRALAAMAQAELIRKNAPSRNIQGG